jgi:hypothetical protein
MCWLFFVFLLHVVQARYNKTKMFSVLAILLGAASTQAAFTITLPAAREGGDKANHGQPCQGEGGERIYVDYIYETTATLSYDLNIIDAYDGVNVEVSFIEGNSPNFANQARYVARTGQCNEVGVPIGGFDFTFSLPLGSQPNGPPETGPIDDPASYRNGTAQIRVEDPSGGSVYQCIDYEFGPPREESNPPNFNPQEPTEDPLDSKASKVASMYASALLTLLGLGAVMGH